MKSHNVMTIDVQQLFATIDLMKVEYGDSSEVALDFGKADEAEREEMLEKLLRGITMTGLQGGLLAVFTGGMLIQREMARREAFEQQMEREMTLGGSEVRDASR